MSGNWRIGNLCGVVGNLKKEVSKDPLLALPIVYLSNNLSRSQYVYFRRFKKKKQDYNHVWWGRSMSFGGIPIQSLDSILILNIGF
ncbi:hypothetical protein TNIN_337741 [Trichonephila inaurata madagascariensis]|uniref:Uncharacterized protein n=1 Tax=Trichonephila inaurata madagascariensis TaxID=2747483 RepID=A0A8X6M6L0_9ARAC|nr:hypothetical protein TNIN_337741 [Trichonephila inaurata madagascariensis]